MKLSRTAMLMATAGLSTADLLNNPGLIGGAKRGANKHKRGVTAKKKAARKLARKMRHQ